jgi:hypothetical protein
VLTATARPPLGRRESAILVVAAAALCGVVAAVEGRGENAFGNMGFVHLDEADHVLRGVGFGRDYGAGFVPDLFVRPPYTLFLCPPLAAIGRHWTTLRVVVAALQGALLGVAGLAVGRTLVAVGASRAARLAAWGVVLHPVLVSQAATFVDTTLFAVAMVGAYALAATTPSDARRSRGLATGLVFGAAILARSTALAVGPALLLAIRRRAGGARRSLATAALVAVGAAAILAPWLVRNHALTGRFLLSTVDGVNLWMGNNEHTGRFLHEERSLDELPGRARYDSSTKATVAEQVESCDAARTAALAFIREHPGHAAFLAARKSVDLWSITPTPRSSRSTVQELKDVVAMLWTVPLYAFAVVGLVAAARAGGALRAFAGDVALTAVLFTLPHAAAWGGTRLRAPLDPFLVALAAVGVVTTWSRLRRRG